MSDAHDRFDLPQRCDLHRNGRVRDRRVSEDEDVGEDEIVLLEVILGVLVHRDRWQWRVTDIDAEDGDVDNSRARNAGLLRLSAGAGRSRRSWLAPSGRQTWWLRLP